MRRRVKNGLWLLDVFRFVRAGVGHALRWTTMRAARAGVAGAAPNEQRVGRISKMAMPVRKWLDKQYRRVAICVLVATSLFALSVCEAEEPGGESLTSEPAAKSQGLYTYRGRIHDIAFSLDGKTVLTGSDNGARLWDAATGESRGKIMKHDHAVYHVAFSPDGKTVLTTGEDSTARLWDVATGEPRGKIMKHDHRIQDVAFSPDGKTVLT